MADLSVSPEEFPVAAAALGVEEATLTGVAEGARAAALPVGPGLDFVSRSVELRFAAYNVEYFTFTDDALLKLAGGSHGVISALEPYIEGDISGGQQVRGVHIPR